MPLLFANGTWWLCCEWVCVCCLAHGSVLEGEEPPVYCDGLVVAGVNSSMGFNFSDGSPVSSAYANDSECYFLLQSDQGTRVSMDLQAVFVGRRIRYSVGKCMACFVEGCTCSCSC